MKHGSVVMAAVVALAAAAPARADRTRVALTAEAGAGSMLSDLQRRDLGLGFGVAGALRAGYTVREPLALQVALRDWWFPSTEGYARVTLLGAGARLEPLFAGGARPWVDANAGVGITGSLARFSFDVGAGVAFAAGRSVAVGPFLRYGQTVTGGGDFPTDAKYWAVGYALTFRLPPPASARPAPPPPATP